MLLIEIIEHNREYLISRNLFWLKTTWGETQFKVIWKMKIGMMISDKGETNVKVVWCPQPLIYNKGIFCIIIEGIFFLLFFPPKTFLTIKWAIPFVGAISALGRAVTDPARRNTSTPVCATELAMAASSSALGCTTHLVRSIAAVFLPVTVPSRGQALSIALASRTSTESSDLKVDHTYCE